MYPHRGFCAVSLCKDALVFIPAKPVYYGYSNQQNAPQKTAVLCDTGKGEFIMARVYNFSAGPSMLPEKVLKQAQAELLEYGDSGQSVMEMSHRSKWFDAIIKDTEAALDLQLLNRDGAHGSDLTEAGNKLLDTYLAIEEKLQKEAEELFEAAFK